MSYIALMATVAPTPPHPYSYPSTPGSLVTKAGAYNTKRHHLSPLWNKQRDVSFFGRHMCWMSLSEAAGHCSFVFLGLGFLETDVLPLRVYAAAGERRRSRV